MGGGVQPLFGDIRSEQLGLLTRAVILRLYLSPRLSYNQPTWERAPKLFSSLYPPEGARLPGFGRPRPGSQGSPPRGGSAWACSLAPY